MKIIDGKKIAERIKDDIVKEIVSFKGARPNLAIVLIGDRDDSKLYVNLKEREAKKVGIDTHIYKCPSNIGQEEVLGMIDHLNKDELIDAILVQLPLPDGLDTDKIIESIDENKDVDGFHPENLKKLANLDGSSEVIMPPVFDVVFEMLSDIDCEIKDKKICILSNSEIFGKNLAKALECKQGKVSVVYPDDKNLENETKQADILISAIGRPGFVKKEMIKDDAVIIDIGITKVDKVFKGDVDFDDVDDKASYITPVPGGVGPLTIAMALKNTLDLYKRNHR